MSFDCTVSLCTLLFRHDHNSVYQKNTCVVSFMVPHFLKILKLRANIDLLALAFFETPFLLATSWAPKNAHGHIINVLWSSKTANIHVSFQRGHKNADLATQVLITISLIIFHHYFIMQCFICLFKHNALNQSSISNFLLLNPCLCMFLMGMS